MLHVTLTRLPTMLRQTLMWECTSFRNCMRCCVTIPSSDGTMQKEVRIVRSPDARVAI
jgi:hypothetical protein